jgi:non-ribosomal peptide synthetase component F
MGVHESLPPVALTYAAWGAAEREYWQPPELEKRATYWKPILAGRPRLWSAREGPGTASGPHQRWVTCLPTSTAEAAQELARVTGATLYSTLLAVFQIALHRWTGNADTLVGTPIANRTTQPVREIMGYCASIVPLRMHVDPREKFSDDLRAVHQTTVESFGNAMPFSELAAAVGDMAQPGHNPIFEVRFALQNHPIPDVTLHGLSAKLTMRSTGTARFHLGCELTVLSHGLEVVWLFRPELFPRVEIEELARIFVATLESACRSPESRIATLLN